MGSDCRIILPNRVRVADVGVVIGVLAGFPAVRKELDGGSYYATCPAVKVRGSESQPHVAQIIIQGETPCIDGDKCHHVLYFFEPSEYDGKALYPPSTPFWIAVGFGLLDFFGGEIECKDAGHSVSMPQHPSISPTTGDAWVEFQQRILNLQPLTKDAMRATAKYAAYPEWGIFDAESR